MIGRPGRRKKSLEADDDSEEVSKARRALLGKHASTFEERARSLI